jgi:antitoxin (DNA-binding transcriptional repressor) of toxin-antitoxin stability system
MKAITATEVARNLSRILDDLEHGGDEIVVLRNKQPVARLIPGTPRMTALEALSDLHRTLDDTEGDAWLADMQAADHLLVREVQDPWA